MSYMQTGCHLVYSTKRRAPALEGIENRRRLFAYIHGILSEKNCQTYRINGGEDHIHICASIHQNVAMSDLIRDLKTSTNKFIRQKKALPAFPRLAGWVRWVLEFIS